MQLYMVGHAYSALTLMLFLNLPFVLATQSSSPHDL